MASDDKPGKPRKARSSQAAGYQSARRPKLRGITLIEPRPLPMAADDLDRRFGAAAEDGLRILAALETMQSLEPDFGEDLAAEASVAIIERTVASDTAADQEQEAAPAGSLRARLGNAVAAPDIIADEYAAYRGPVEEAMVEIVEVPAPDLSGRRRRKSRSGPRRFFKTRTGGG
jgi:hypothetical protein